MTTQEELRLALMKVEPIAIAGGVKLDDLACFIEIDKNGDVKQRYWYIPCTMPQCHGQSTDRCGSCGDHICPGCRSHVSECWYCCNSASKEWERE